MTIVLDRSDVRVSRSAPDTVGTWRQVVDEFSQSNLGHSPEWFTVIRSAYGHDPLYLSAEDGEGRHGVLPAFVVRRPVLGTVVTSMPFLDSGGPCASSVGLAHLLDRKSTRLNSSH